MDLNDVKRALSKKNDAQPGFMSGAVNTPVPTAEERRRMIERAQSLLLRALKADKHHAPAACGLADQFILAVSTNASGYRQLNVLLWLVRWRIRMVYVQSHTFNLLAPIIIK
jgi:hypothetical protein